MPNRLFIAELCIAGPGQQIVVTAHNLRTRTVPVFLVDSERYHDFLDSIDQMHDMPVSTAAVKLAKGQEQVIWTVHYQARWRVAYRSRPFAIQIEVEVQPLPPLEAKPFWLREAQQPLLPQAAAAYRRQHRQEPFQPR